MSTSTCRLSDIGRRRVRQVDDVLLSTQCTLPCLVTEIDREVHVLGGVCSELTGRRRNRCVGILRLPPEILGHILSIVGDEDPPHRGTLDTSFDPLLGNEARADEMATLGWIRMGHVCRLLRGILMSHRHLWARAAFSLIPEATEDILLRAKGASPVIDVNSGYRTPPGLAWRAQRQYERARIISIGDALPGLSSILWPWTPRLLGSLELPCLEHLTLMMCQSSRHTNPEVYELPAIHAPRLVSLTLLNYFVPFDRLRSPHLTSLDLVYVHPSRDALPEVAQFWVVLDGCSNLRRLSICNFLPELQSASGQPTNALRFGCLEELRVSDELSRAMALWMHIRIPGKARVWLRMNGADGESEMFECIASLSDHVREAAAVVQVWGLGIYDDYALAGGARFVLASREPGAGSPDHVGPIACDGDIKLSVSLTPATTGQDGVSVDTVELLNRVVAEYGLVQLETLELFSLQEVRVMGLADALRTRLPTVRCLVTDAFPDSADVPGLWTSVFSGSVEQSQPLVLPDLQTVWIVDVTYMCRDEEEVLSASAEGELRRWAARPAWSELLQMLAARRQRGVPLKRFVAQAWHTDNELVSGRMIAWIGEHVESVTAALRVQEPCSWLGQEVHPCDRPLMAS